MGQSSTKFAADQEVELRKKAAIREKMWLEELERIDEEAKERAARAQTVRQEIAKLEASKK